MGGVARSRGRSSKVVGVIVARWWGRGCEVSGVSAVKCRLLGLRSSVESSKV